MTRSRVCASCRDEKGHCDGARVSCSCICTYEASVKCAGCEEYIYRYFGGGPDCCQDCLMTLVAEQLGPVAKWWIDNELQSLKNEISDLEDRINGNYEYRGGCSYCS